MLMILRTVGILAILFFTAPSAEAVEKSQTQKPRGLFEKNDIEHGLILWHEKCEPLVNRKTLEFKIYKDLAPLQRLLDFHSEAITRSMEEELRILKQNCYGAKI